MSELKSRNGDFLHVLTELRMTMRVNNKERICGDEILKFKDITSKFCDLTLNLFENLIYNF